MSDNYISASLRRLVEERANYHCEYCLLLNPRNQHWNAHFTWEEVTIVGLSTEGRTTVKLLQMNTQERLAERRRLYNT
jgi:hypothetical protein